MDIRFDVLTAVVVQIVVVWSVTPCGFESGHRLSKTHPASVFKVEV
jgi:hypothetical protein